MPVEIRELIIRAVAEDPALSLPSDQEDRESLSEEAIISACVKEVMRILKKEKER